LYWVAGKAKRLKIRVAGIIKKQVKMIFGAVKLNPILNPAKLRRSLN
jgi:hypothetical protein